MTPAFRLVVLLMTLVALDGMAQELEPRRWTPLPIGMNVASAGLVYNQGDIAFNPVLRLEDVEVKIKSAGFGYLHAFDLLGQTARVDVHLPYMSARWEGLLDGVAASTEREGFGDPRIRLSVNFLGAPALKGKEFVAYRRSHRVHTVAGAALAVSLPLGEYHRDKFLNLGSNRYAIRPQIGVVHSRGPWSYELTGSVFFYTDNDEFLNSNTLEQDPLFTVQSHIVYSAPTGWWASVGAAYDHGGETAVNGESSDDLKKDVFFGISAGRAITRATSMKLAYIGKRTQTDVGTDSDRLVLAFSVRF